MFDYTSSARSQDRAERYDYGMTPRAVRRLDPVVDHRDSEALASLCSLTPEDVDRLAAREAAAQETDRIEGHILTTKTPAHLNPHD